jgi:hypothetical protein
MMPVLNATHFQMMPVLNATLNASVAMVIGWMADQSGF